jgi:hypothetical protein
MKLKFLFASLILVALTAVTAEAQPRVRAKNQRERIKQGVRNGELTRSETKNLVQDQKELRSDIKEAKKDDGKIDKEERKDIRKEQNKNSRKIYRKKHNARERN